MTADRIHIFLNYFTTFKQLTERESRCNTLQFLLSKCIHFFARNTGDFFRDKYFNRQQQIQIF